MISFLRRQQIVNAVLLGVALALAVLVFATRERITTSEAEARSNNLLQAYDEEAVTRIRFERSASSFTLVRTKMDDAGEGTWALTEPFAEDAEPFSVQKLLGTLEYSSAFRRIKPEEVNRAGVRSRRARPHHSRRHGRHQVSPATRQGSGIAEGCAVPRGRR